MLNNAINIIIIIIVYDTQSSYNGRGFTCIPENWEDVDESSEHVELYVMIQ